VEAVKRGLRATPGRCRRSIATTRGHGHATVELLKVLLRMTLGAPWRRRKVIATTDDLDRIAPTTRPCAGDARLRRELFGERRSPSSTDVWRWRWKGRVVTVTRIRTKADSISLAPRRPP